MSARSKKILMAVVVLLSWAGLFADRFYRVVPGATSEGVARAEGYFSHDYFAARGRFRKKVNELGGRLSSIAIDAKGPGDEDLTIDIGWFGSSKPRRALLHSSGVHGVEGFAGSAIQLQLLDALSVIPANSALVLVHVINPYGMAWRRRVNENNVDLNRNFLAEPADYRGAPDGYAALDSFLNPTASQWPDLFIPKVMWLIARHGLPTLRQTVSGGQYEFPRGLFFGGKKLQQGPERLQQWLSEQLGSAESIVAVDVHTGLGKSGEDTLLVEDADYDRLRPLFGERVKGMNADQGPAYQARGTYVSMIARVLKNAHPRKLTQEFGTYNAVSALRALRDENRAYHYDAVNPQSQEKAVLKEAFCLADEGWRRRVLERGAELIEKAREVAFGGGEQ